jgi:hypothetical protein
MTLPTPTPRIRDRERLNAERRSVRPKPLADYTRRELTAALRAVGDPVANPRRCDIGFIRSRAARILGSAAKSERMAAALRHERSKRDKQ